MISYWIEGNL